MNLPPFAERFGFFDPKLPYVVTYGELPHWEQEGASYFITFRTADSIPAVALDLIRRQRDDWLRRHGINSDSENWSALLCQQPLAQQREFHREIARQFESALDKGHGSCPLRDPVAAQIVADALLHFDGVHVAESLRDSEASCGATRPHIATRPLIGKESGRGGIRTPDIHVVSVAL